jgi:hypothetical protein
LNIRSRGPSPASRDQDFGWWLKRHQNASSSNPTGPTKTQQIAIGS